MGRILINRKNVFSGNPVEDQRFPYNWGNRLHIVTQESFIRQELVFREGDILDSEHIQESERNLRRRPIFRYVRLLPQEPVNGVSDVVVETEDVWTTSLRLGYGAAGGKSFYRLGILEQNFLGNGHTVGAFVRKDIDRLVRGLTFRDPHFFNTRWELFGGYGRDQKGKEWIASLERPFFSSVTPYSTGGSFRLREDEDRLFEGGDEVARFYHRSEDLRVFGSRALDPNPERVRRISLIHEKRKDEFAEAAFPPAHTVSAIMLGFDFQNVDFVKRRGVRTFDRDEDVNRGWEWLTEAGPSLEKFGATQDGALGHVQVKKSFVPGEKQVWFNHLDLDGRHEQEQFRNMVARFRTHYFLLDWRPDRRGGENNAASLRGEFVTSKNPDMEEQFLLGGENGLRGYSVRQFSGNKRALVTLENRETLELDWLRLINLGWAVFIDTGGVWKEHEDPSFSDFKSDVGVGLRFAPSRSVEPGLIRIDLAYALQDNDRSSRFVVNIGADLSFGEKRVRKFDQ